MLNYSVIVIYTGLCFSLRYLLPALCHLSAEEGPRKVLLSLDTPAVLVDFLVHGWGVLKTQSGKTVNRDPSLETACSALLNFVVTEPERVRYTETKQFHILKVKSILTFTHVCLCILWTGTKYGGYWFNFE